MRTHYYIYGIVIASDVTLPSLGDRAVRGDDESVSFVVASGEAPPEPSDWFRETAAGTAMVPYLSTGNVDGGYLLRFHSAVDFWIRADGRAITAYPRAADLDTVEQLFLDQALPQALTMMGAACLHASCVALGGQAYAFVGASGAGKSTIASALVPPGELVSDDCVVLRLAGTAVRTYAGYSSVRLREDSARATMRGGRPVSTRMTWKSRIHLPVSAASVTLRGVYLLDDGKEAHISMVRPIDAMHTLIRNMHRLDPNDTQALRNELTLLSWVIDKVGVQRLHYPHSFSSLTALSALVVADMEKARS